MKKELEEDGKFDDGREKGSEEGEIVKSERLESGRNKKGEEGVEEDGMRN